MHRALEPFAPPGLARSIDGAPCAVGGYLPFDEAAVSADGLDQDKRAQTLKRRSPARIVSFPPRTDPVCGCRRSHELANVVLEWLSGPAPLLESLAITKASASSKPTMLCPSIYRTLAPRNPPSPLS